MENHDQPGPGELCKPCNSARAVEHHHGTPARYCARCALLQSNASKDRVQFLQFFLGEAGEFRSIRQTKIQAQGAALLASCLAPVGVALSGSWRGRS